MLYDILKKLCAVRGISGREMPVAKVIQEMITPYVDEVRYDAMGNLIACKRGTATAPRKIMFCAHMDEIGFLVNFIEESGLIRFAPIGGINPVAAFYSTVTFENGVRGILVPEKSDSKLSAAYVDIGARDRKDAERRVSIGDSFALTGHVQTLSRNVWAGRPLDDRIGCAILVEAASRITTTVDDLYFVFSVQEEVGCRGGKTAAASVLPDCGFALDVTGTGDAPGSGTIAVKRGGGAAVKLKDSSVICDPALVRGMLRLAEERKIPAQKEILERGGTDASAIQLSGTGARAGGISIPSRGIHSGVETVDRRDCNACVDLVCAIAEVGMDGLLAN